jgi:hypothetical protein
MVSCPQCHVDGARIVHCTNGTIVYECPLCNYFFLVKQIGQEALTDGRIFRGAVPEAERVFDAGVINAEGDDDAMLADMDAVDE